MTTSKFPVQSFLDASVLRQPPVRQAYKDPVGTFIANAMGTAHHVLAPPHGYPLPAQALNGLQAASFEGAWNFGPDAADELTVRTVVEKLAALWGGGRRLRPSGDVGASS